MPATMEKFMEFWFAELTNKNRGLPRGCFGPTSAIEAALALNPATKGNSLRSTIGSDKNRLSAVKVSGTCEKIPRHSGLEKDLYNVP